MSDPQKSDRPDLERVLQRIIDLVVDGFFGTIELSIHAGEIKQIAERRVRKPGELESKGSG